MEVGMHHVWKILNQHTSSSFSTKYVFLNVSGLTSSSRAYVILEHNTPLPEWQTSSSECQEKAFLVQSFDPWRPDECPLLPPEQVQVTGNDLLGNPWYHIVETAAGQGRTQTAWLWNILASAQRFVQKTLRRFSLSRNEDSLWNVRGNLWKKEDLS